MSTNLQLNAGTLASNCWPAAPQTLYNEMFALGSALMGDITGILIQEATPDAVDRDKGWIKLVAGAPVNPYNAPAVWFNGHWVVRHGIEAESPYVALWTGDTATLGLFDGGDGGGVVSAISGPMWEVVADLAAKFPVGVGTTANGTVINQGSTGGEDEHTLTLAELPADPLTLAVKAGQADNLDSDTLEILCNPDPAENNKANNPVTLEIPFGDGDPHTNMPPYYGVYFIRRTARVYFLLA